MKLSDFDYVLPDHLIAHNPMDRRDKSKMLLLNKLSWNIEDKIFSDILDLLSDNDVLILNDTKVINARLFWKIEIKIKKKTFFKDVEVFLHRQINDSIWECLWFPWNNFKIWKTIKFYSSNWNNILNWNIKEYSNMWRYIEFDKSWKDLISIIDKIWELPLPPYIKTNLLDNERYQTVFANKPWSVAAPTAWLHFTKDLLNKLENKWVIIEKVLLHVWIWTFKPVEEEDIVNHKMHSEYIEISEEVSKRLNIYKSEWKNIIAVWTTSVRVLESFIDSYWNIWYWSKDTSIFIYPWYNWKFVDWLITNFHLPKSSLLMLVSSFAWVENIKKAYIHAIENNYRFFSFWDAMFIK